MTTDHSEASKCQVCGLDMFEWPWAEGFAHVSSHINQNRKLLISAMTISTLALGGFILAICAALP